MDADLSDRLAEACADPGDGTPGAVLGVWHDGRLEVTTFGVLSARTQVPVTADSVFQIGSVTKPWTAAVIAALAASGRLDLDSTVADLLPGVRLGRDDLGHRVTVRHLLTHTSGLDGDVFIDTGGGDDCIARYVDLLADAVTVHEPGAAYSYCNSGYVVLGRIAEVVDGAVWDDVLQRRIAGPLGLADVCTLAEQAVLRRAVVGHESGEPVTTWALPRALGPAGTITTTAADLLGFARQWLADDVPAHLAAMTEPLAEVPDGSDVEDVGWGWRVGRWGEHRVIGHTGLTLGQSATLRIVPSLGLAVCLLTNGERADAVHHRLVPQLVRDLTGVEVPLPAGPAPATHPDRDALTPHVGRYLRRAARYDVDLDGVGLWATVTPTGELASHGSPPERLLLRPRAGGGPDGFVRRASDTEPWAPLTFGTLPDGTPMLIAGGRVAVRAS